MTEEEWLACEEPFPILDYLQHKASGRRLRLLAAGCCRKIWHQLPDDRCRTAVEACEKYADGAANEAELTDAGIAATAASFAVNEHTWGPQLAGSIAKVCATESLGWSVRSLAVSVARLALQVQQAPVYLWQSVLLRDIFGNPFQPVTCSPEWRTDTAVALARQMYESRDFGAMPILADALQDVGCDNEDILSHCRGEGPHVRGCWVVDLVLGKE